MASNEDRPKEPNEIESLNQGALNIEELSPEELEQVAGGTVPVGCTDFQGTCTGFTGGCNRFGPGSSEGSST